MKTFGTFGTSETFETFGDMTGKRPASFKL
jgi:hypothetical protein